VARVGAQLYSLREECERDLEGTLRALAALGYEGVELFSLHGHDAAAVRRWLDELGLAACGRHARLEALETELDGLAVEAQALGVERLVLSWVDPASIPQAAGRIGALSEPVRAHGLELGVHNHDAEVRPLADGRSFLDLLLEHDLFLELDLGWVWWTGTDPVALLERSRGRCPLVHVKDFLARGELSFCPVGDGSVGYERVAPAAVAAGAEWLIVEQDRTDGPELDAAARSIAALRSML
jgi:sugar phosphate isomerase/epimerase